MLENIKEYFRPSKLNDAIKILKTGKGKYSILAGGTSIIQYPNPKIEGLVSLRDLKLSYIKKNKDSIKIGAMTRISELLENKFIKEFAKGLIYKACDKIGSTLNRNLITVGGNIVQTYKWSDLPVALLVLDTKLKISGNGTKKIPIEKFFIKHPKILLKNYEILTEIEIKEPKGKYGTDFIKFSYTNVDHCLVDVAVYVEVEKDKFKNIKIAFGGIMPLPFRAYSIEKKLKNHPTDSILVNRILDEEVKKINIGEDFRTTKDYKRHLLKVLTYDAIANAISAI